MNYIFINEVQYAISNKELKNLDEVKLYNVLNGLLRLRNVDIYVTGSNSKLLTKDVLTAFRGRGDEVRVYPLSFKEYYNFVGGDKSEAYEEYAMYGGMPLTLSKKNDAATSFYSSIRPSSIRITLSHCSATAGSCVTITIVLPCSLRSRNTFMIS